MQCCNCSNEDTGDSDFYEFSKSEVVEAAATIPEEQISHWNHAHDIDSDRLARVSRDSIEHGDIVYTPTQEAVDEFSEMLEQVKQGADSSVALRAALRGLGSMVDRNIVSIDEDASMMMVLTNFASASSMAIAQLLQLHALSEPMAEPLLVFNLERKGTFSEKEVETKLLVAELALGYTKCHVLSPNAKCVDVQKSNVKHAPITKKFASAYNQTVSAIADKLSAFTGKVLYLYIMAPGNGNLHAIVSALKEKGAWPLRSTKWVVSLYSGSHNMKGMSREDLFALEEIMKHSDKPLLDVAKYTFFGKSPQPPVTESSEHFAVKGFAGYLSREWPLLATGFKILNDEVNAYLVKPHNLFHEELNKEEQHRFHEISALYNPGDMDSIRAYCEALCCDDPLFHKMQSFKRSTFNSFSLGGCDSPLSDQLIFLHNWLQRQNPNALSCVVGKWSFNERQGFTEILPGVLGGIQAVQPKLVDPWDATILHDMREALFEYFKKHLDARKVPTNILRVSVCNLPRERFLDQLIEEELLVRARGHDELLLNLMDDKWENGHIAIVLRAIGKKYEDLPKLQEIMTGLFEKESLQNFFDSLMQIRDHRSAPFKSLSSSNSSHRAEAIWILGELAAGHCKLAKAVAILLMHTMLADKQCRAEAAKALVKVGTKDSELTQAIGSVLQNRLEKTALVNTFCEAARSLGKLGFARCTDLLLGALGTSEVAEQRQMAAKLLGKFVANYNSEAAKVAPALMTTLEQDGFTIVQAAAAQALGMLDRSNRKIVGEAIDSLLSALKKVTSPEVRSDAIHALSKLVEVQDSSWSSCLALVQDTAFGETQHWRTRIEAVKSLGVLGQCEAISQVLASAQNDATRECAAITLGHVALARPKQKSVVLQRLEHALSIDTSEKVRRSCAKALIKLGAPPPKKQTHTDDTYSSNEHIRTALKGKDTILLKGSWLLSLCRRGGKLPQRQQMPEDSMWEVQELMGKVDNIDGQGMVQIVSISYCWQTKEHPDPNCEQLYKLCRIVEQLLANSPFDDDNGIADLAMFLDFCSIHQPERTDAETEAFFRALKNINLWYAHRSTVVWLMTAVPILSQSQSPAFLPYGDRGWPSFERAICELSPKMNGVYDMGKMSAYCVHFGKEGEKGTAWRCKAGRCPPQIPAKFNKALQDKVFTDSSDHNFVMRKYEQTFQEVMGSVKHLSCGRLDWGNKAALAVAESLDFCTQLEDLWLDRNKIGDAGARVLAIKFPRCKSLKRLWLGGNMIGDIGAKALADAIQFSNALEKLGLFHNRISDDGAIALAEGIGKCPNLQRCSLAENFIGDAGACKIFAVLPACKKLKYLNLSQNLIALDGIRGLAEALPKTLLEVLELKDNRFKDDVEATRVLAKLLPKCPHLCEESKKGLSLVYM